MEKAELDKALQAAFERGRVAEQDRLATELLARGGFATLQLNSDLNGLPRMQFVAPSETEAVNAMRLSNGKVLFRS